MSLLLDTHAFLWYALDDARLGAAARAAIDHEPDAVFISPASYWELAIKVGYGRYKLYVPFDEFWGKAIAEGQLAILPIEIRHASRVITLPLVHRDPFDRMIVAQALSENADLVSNDAELDGYGVSQNLVTPFRSGAGETEAQWLGKRISMTAKLIDGKSLSASIRESVARDVAALKAQGRPVRLVALLAGENSAARVYAGNQKKTCAEVGIDYELQSLPEAVSAAELHAAIHALNRDPRVTGMFLHAPLPAGLDLPDAQYQIDILKDVEGVNPANIGHVVYGHTIIAPCTALAVVELIDTTGIPLQGANVTVVGASRIVGRPLALLLTERNATVTLCHIYTRDTAAMCRGADIVVVAAGKPGLIRAEHLKPGAVVIDVGINRVKVTDAFGKVTEKTVGDVDFEAVKEVAGFITPVPGGVGPMTVAMLLRNTVRAAKLVYGLEKPLSGGDGRV